jgi:hypothetical protein
VPLHVNAADGRIGDEFVEVVHHLGLGQHGQLAQGSIGETGVEALVEG